MSRPTGHPLQEIKDTIFFLCSHLLAWGWYTVGAQFTLVKDTGKVGMEAGPATVFLWLASFALIG